MGVSHLFAPTKKWETRFQILNSANAPACPRRMDRVGRRDGTSQLRATLASRPNTFEKSEGLSVLGLSSGDELGDLRIVNIITNRAIFQLFHDLIHNWQWNQIPFTGDDRVTEPVLDLDLQPRGRQKFMQ